jgi:predicted transcriptional regulator
MTFSGTFKSSLDPTFVGLGALVAIYTIALVLLRELPRIRRLKFTATGLEAELMELKRQVTGEARLISPEAKEDIQGIRKTTRDPQGIFLEIIVEIEKKLHLIAEMSGLAAWRYSSVPVLLNELLKKEVIDMKMRDYLLVFWRMRNRVVHGEVDITTENLDEIINISEKLLSMLDHIYESIPSKRIKK